MNERVSMFIVILMLIASIIMFCGWLTEWRGTVHAFGNGMMFALSTLTLARFFAWLKYGDELC